MQSSYAMVMLSYKSHAMALVDNSGGPTSLLGDTRKTSNIGGPSYSKNSDGAVRARPVKKLLEKLEEGLDMILGALRNYAVAYEALCGMRDQIEIAARSVGSMELENSMSEGSL
jgi:hypothetical protein